MSKQRKAWDTVLAVVMILLCLLWVYPIVLILINSLKVEGTFTTSTVFQLPTKYSVITLATERLVQRMHDHNLAVHFWTINDPEEMRFLIGIGADGIMTDYPHRLAEVYASYGK